MGAYAGENSMTGFYLHVPFCDKKCSYCDFYSIESVGLIDRYVDSVIREIQRRADAVPGPITSVFFGGGTPSLLSPLHLQRIIDTLLRETSITSDAEWTMECNPGTVTHASLAAYRSSGINRLSFGVQSIHADELAFLDRIHTADQAYEAVELARRAGFDNVNVDVMFALPNQSAEKLSATLDRVIQLEPDHVSAYSLIYEPGTPLYARMKKGLVVPESEEHDAELYALVIERLVTAGYEQYEVSNFSRNGATCRHNLTYWQGLPYISVGPSAHGFDGDVRYWNLRSLTAWTEAVERGELPEANREVLSHFDKIVELAFLTLRADGLPLTRFYTDYGIDVVAALGPQLGYWLDADFVTLNAQSLRLTSRGYAVCDELTVKLVGAIEAALLAS